MTPMPETFAARLVAARGLTPRVRELVFQRVDGRPFVFAPGQWVSLVLPLLDERGRGLRRSYSLAAEPDGSARFTLIVTRIHGGAGSAWLHDAGEGTVVDVKGPQGSFSHLSDVPSLFVATGTGIAPCRAMLRQALATGGASPLWVLMGAREEGDALYRDEFEGLAQTSSRVRYALTLSRPGPGWAGRRGYVQAHVGELWRALSEGGASPHAYVCGVKKMLTEVRVVLREQLGVERQRVHVESYD